MNENRRCSILFHLLVPGGRWQVVMGILNSSASFCNSTFHSRTREPLLPPPSAVISKLLRVLRESRPGKKQRPTDSLISGRGLSGSTVAPFPHPAHRTGCADFPHPALGQDLTPSPTARRARARSGVRARSARKGARVDKPRPCVA